MLWIGLAAVAVLGLIILAAVTEIKGAPSSSDIKAQCCPSRITYTEYPSRRLRWHGLERKMHDELAEVKDDD